MKFLKAFRLLTAVFAIAIASTSCTQDVSTAPEVAVTPAPEIESSLLGDLLGGVVGTTTNLLGNLLICAPPRFEAGEAVIGSAGGTLNLGEVKLVIPRGALRSNVRIRAERPAEPYATVRFSPHGLEFAKPATLTMSYAHCSLTAGLLTPKRIAYTTEQLQLIEYIPSTDNILRREVQGRIDHFSRYAVSW